MALEFYDPQQDIEELKQRLREIKNSLKPLVVEGKVSSSLVPSEIREEVVKIYDEHGGINILCKLTKLGYDTIKKWHKN